MLNKLSFNLAKELNESETKTFKIKKKVFMEGSKVRKETLTEDASSAFDKILSGDEVFFRDSEGQPLVVRYAENYPEPEEYDEGYKEEYGGTAEELEAAKQAAEEGSVWEFNEVDEEGKPTGVTLAIVYGTDQLREMLKDLREVGVIKKLEESAPINSDLKKGKEDRLASLKMQLEKDGNQLADDEKEAIEEEITKLENELQECDNSLKESWTNVYKQFDDIVNKYLKDKDNWNTEAVEKEVEELYAQHKGEPDWDEAYRRWCEFETEEDFNESEKSPKIKITKNNMKEIPVSKENIKATPSIEREMKNKKELKEESYEDNPYIEIEEALDNAGFTVARYTDEGVLTKNIGWVLDNSSGKTVYLTCDGTWLDEGCNKSLKEDDYEDARPWSTALIRYCENYGTDIIWEEMLRAIIKASPDNMVGEFIKDFYPNSIAKPEDLYPGEIDESALNEKYSEKLGGDSEDFVSDVETIKTALEAIDTDSFGAKLSQQMVWDWIDTCNYQIERGNRLTKGEFNESEEKPLTEGFSLDKVQIVDTCERRGEPIALVNLSPIKDWEEYVVAFNYTTENNEVSWSYGYYYYDEESARKAFEKVKAGGNLSESSKVEKKPITEAAETSVKDLQVIKEQGNVYMLEDKSEGTRYIVGENYNLSEGEIENAEIYNTKEDADKDYLDRCEITKTEESTQPDQPLEDVNETDESLRQISEEEKINKLKMMDNVARRVNDEELFYNYWLAFGVPDEATEEDYQEIAEEDYEEMEQVFKKLMKAALEDGLYNATKEELEFARKYEPEIKNAE